MFLLEMMSFSLNERSCELRSIVNRCIELTHSQIKAYNISNQSTSYKAQSYDQNKLSFDSIASQMTVSQVKNRN